MRKEFDEEFDLQIRKAMEEAQEPAPAGAWEAVSSRLDALAPVAAAGAGASSAAVGRRVWYWAGAALAAAAAVALGIFFIGTTDNNSNLININSGSGIVAQTVVPAEKPAETRPQPAQTVVPAEKPAETGPQQAETVVSDPFALMAFEDGRKKSGNTHGISLLIKGGSTGNNASAGKLSMGAPGAYMQSGIIETSKSSFGIPVIGGIGVRMHLNETLSIGTGVDYSLLTRTFEGRYTEGLVSKSGDFSHTLQYIGIPVDIFVNLVRKNDILLYSVIGTEAEKAVSNKYRLLGTDTIVGDSVNGLQWSLGAGLGLECNVGKRTGLFAEPSVKYYFNCDQPKSLRTDKPFQMVLRAGVRFDL